MQRSWITVVVSWWEWQPNIPSNGCPGNILPVEPLTVTFNITMVRFGCCWAIPVVTISSKAVQLIAGLCYWHVLLGYRWVSWQNWSPSAMRVSEFVLWPASLQSHICSDEVYLLDVIGFPVDRSIAATSAMLIKMYVAGQSHIVNRIWHPDITTTKTYWKS